MRSSIAHRSATLLALVALTLLTSMSTEAADAPTARPARPKASAMDEHVAKLHETAPKEFSIVVSAPFVVLGDGEPDSVKKSANGVVAWAVDKLKQDYFQADPKDIIDVWLFKDDASYRHHAKLLFDDEPDTPYGYYSETHRALVMNISTGGGTLVHEIVHPFIHANFPDCPSWFNEGLASLYEQTSEKDGHIWGLINWRYAGLEKAIRDGKLLSFEKLTGLNTKEFYGGDAYNAHYAQARYLCFYLQEKGLLRKYYREFVANVKTDPTGYNTLQRVLEEKDMAAFQKRWEKFILDLHPR
jgi:hypothetical protein